MNLAKNGTLHPHLRDDEALVVENAIRLAIDSIINVLYGVNSSRTHEFQRMVADRDKEIQRLESRLKEVERELQVQRRHGCSSGVFENVTASHGLAGPQTTGDPQRGFEPSYTDAEMAAVQQDCEMSLSLGLFARPSSHISTQSHESVLPSSPNRDVLEQSCTSHSPESSAMSETARNLPPSPSSFIVKEEPCDMETFFIKWEMSEEGLREPTENTSCPYQNKETPCERRKQDDRDKRKFGENSHAETVGCNASEGEHLRNKKKSVPMSELPEEAQRLKRAAWRAASRRYYARKVARQQAKTSQSVPFPHITDSQCSADRRRRMLISELPNQSQAMQREAWRAASRRYYARKTSRLQNENTQYVHLLQNTEPSEETLGSNRGGSHSGGGIMCS